MSRVTAILTSLGVATLLASVAGSSYSMPARFSSTVSAVDGRASLGAVATAPMAMSRAQARAFVAAVNLRIQDVPGFKASSEHETESSAEKASERKMPRCAGSVGSSKDVAKASSETFQRESRTMDQIVSSNVSVASSPELALRALKALRSASVRDCLKRYVSQIFRRLARGPQGGVNVLPVAVTRLSLSAPGTAGSFGWRMSATISDHGAKVPFHMDLAGFVDGPAEVAMFALGLPEPFPSATEARLFAALVHRSIAHLG